MKKPKVAIFVNHPQCSVQSAHGVIRSLYFDYSIDCISNNHLKDRTLAKYDMIVFPGGLGDSDTWHDIVEPYKDAVMNRIAKGGRYLGICMGAYWAGHHYFNITNIKAEQYITRPNADVKRSFGTVTNIRWLEYDEKMYFYDGCSLIGDEKDYDVIARYSNGDAAAVIQNNIGLIGPHPESDIYWFDKPYMQKHWHHYRHNQLLVQFVRRLFN